jgi:phytoene dehydrogenase-like protein
MVAFGLVPVVDTPIGTGSLLHWRSRSRSSKAVEELFDLLLAIVVYVPVVVDDSLAPSRPAYVPVPDPSGDWI